MEVKSKPSLHASWIDTRAKEIVRRLQDRGYTTYLVGGCVRDLLAGLHPKDYDIATSALPNDVKKVVPGSYVIGRRFRLVLVKRGLDQYEVATFRRASRPEDFIEGDEAAPVGDNFFGTPEEDALRRDFTINALFYDPIRDELIDYAEGLPDIEQQTLRMIGDPSARIVEDPIRSLRAIRLSHKLSFRIESELREAIAKHTQEVGLAVLPRKREEYLKFLRLPHPSRAFLELWDLGLLPACLPSLVPIFEDSSRSEIFLSFLDRMDEAGFEKDKPVELYTAFLLGFDEALRGHSDFEKLRDQLCRNELGLFKSESAEIAAALELKDRLQAIDSFQKRGARRQSSFLTQPLLPFALRIAAFQRELTPAQLWYWSDRLNSPKVQADSPRSHEQS